MKKKIVISDLDGTVLPAGGQISETNIKCFNTLKDKGYTRVIATGRSVYSAYKVMEEDFPIDYLVFSTGAGILDWKNKELIYNKHFSSRNTKKIAKTLIKEDIDFMVFYTIPENHKFKYYRTNKNNPDFERRLKTFIDFSEPLTSHKDCNYDSCQILAILPENEGNDKFNHLAGLFPYANVIKATSPTDNKSVWLELFPREVSKGHTCLRLMKQLNIDPSDSYGVGNDYNDIAFLEICKESFVVGNAPDTLKDIYNILPPDTEDGFACLLDKIDL